MNLEKSEGDINAKERRSRRSLMYINHTIWKILKIIITKRQQIKIFQKNILFNAFFPF